MEDNIIAQSHFWSHRTLKWRLWEIKNTGHWVLLKILGNLQKIFVACVKFLMILPPIATWNIQKKVARELLVTNSQNNWILSNLHITAPKNIFLISYPALFKEHIPIYSNTRMRLQYQRPFLNFFKKRIASNPTCFQDRVTKISENEEDGSWLKS